MITIMPVSKTLITALAIAILSLPPLPAVQYHPADSPSTYQRITAMNEDGTCVSVPQSYSGSLSPFDEELSLHFRGPIHINQIAFYTPAAHNSAVCPPAHDYDRISYYSAAAKTVENLVFLGPHGGEESGVFDLNYGASLAYVSSNGTMGASSPQVLADNVLPSQAEIVVMMDQECAGADCGYIRPGSVAYHGFPGANKVFLIEFSMPDELSTLDMPAIWLLNAQIPRTAQYASPDCSCWASGCGELDIMEALVPGAEDLESTLHPRGFARPVLASVKVAVVFQAEKGVIGIHVVPEAEFGGMLDGEVVDTWAREE